MQLETQVDFLADGFGQPVLGHLPDQGDQRHHAGSLGQAGFGPGQRKQLFDQMPQAPGRRVDTAQRAVAGLARFVLGGLDLGQQRRDGVRNRCAASDTKWRWLVSAVSRRISKPLTSVTTGWISSGTSTVTGRRSACERSASSARKVSSGRNPERTPNQMTDAATRTSNTSGNSMPSRMSRTSSLRLTRVSAARMVTV